MIPPVKFTCGMCHKETRYVPYTLVKGAAVTDLCSHKCLHIFRQLEKAIIDYIREAHVVHEKKMQERREKEMNR